MVEEEEKENREEGSGDDHAQEQGQAVEESKTWFGQAYCGYVRMVRMGRILLQLCFAFRACDRSPRGAVRDCGPYLFLGRQLAV